MSSSGPHPVARRADGPVTAVRRLASVLLVLLMLTSCSDERDPVADRLEQNAVLRERPSLEQEQARLTAVQDQILEALSTRLGLTAWSQADEGNASRCGDYPDSDGFSASLPMQALTGGVPDAAWDRAVAIIEEVAGPAGFGQTDTVVDLPGEHEVVLTGERESRLRFGTALNATLRFEVGCHLSERTSS